MIVHRTQSDFMLCYVGHHDNAYQWAERRKLETHPKTGAAQLVEVRKTVKEITVPKYVETERNMPTKPLLFAGIFESDLLSYGVPAEWLNDVRNADEDRLLEMANHLPGEAAEALLELAVGKTPQLVQPVTVAKPFEHPDAQRRFRVMHNIAELEHALNYPWEKWAVFLHPAQRQVVEKDYKGPFRVSGAGKTVVAIHRTVFLARANPSARILLTTFSDTIANDLRERLRRLIHNEPRIAEHVEVNAIDTVGKRLYKAQFGSPKIATQKLIQELLSIAASQTEAHNFRSRFLLSE